MVRTTRRWIRKIRRVRIVSNLYLGATLPYKSEKQRKFFNVNKGKLEKSGVDVDEWNKVSKNKKLPKVAPKKK
jgi:hypothetical protein